MENNIKFICPNCREEKSTIDKMGSFGLKLHTPKFDEQTENIEKPYHHFEFVTPGICKSCADSIRGNLETRLKFKDKQKEYLLKVIEKLLNFKLTEKI